MSEDVVKLSHGAGGAIQDKLIQDMFLKIFKKRQVNDGIGLDHLDDGASIKLDDLEVILTIDGHTVDPIFFPGGDLGKLAVCGAVNDISVMGADPIAVLDSIIVEEGYSMEKLRKIIVSMNIAATEAGVAIIAGDFKVMPKGSIDNIVVSTTGVGILKGKRILDSNSKPGDKVIVTNSIGDHGISLLSKREGLSFETDLISDVAPINKTIKAALSAGDVHSMKDITRGGLSMALNDIAGKSGISIWLEADKIPVDPSVKAASDMLGLDPYEVTCEGAAVVVVGKESAQKVLTAIKKTKYGKKSEIIGEVRRDHPGLVLLRTSIGGTRILRKPLGEPIPRVC
jgi:hydrogenase expression/formation protein HypE